MFKKSTLAFTLLAAATGVAQAQPTPDPGAGGAMPAPLPGGDSGGFQKGMLGLSLPLTLLSRTTGAGAGSNAAVDVPTVGVLYFLDDRTALDIVAGFNFHHFEGFDNATPPAAKTFDVFGIAAGAGYRMYKHNGKLHSFIEPQATFVMGDVAGATIPAGSSFVLRVGGLFGAEREISDWFSLSGAIGVGLNFGNKFKDIQFGPTAVLAANFYWK
jgi:hypothetical protein